MSKSTKNLRKEYRRYINEGGLIELYRLIIKPKPRFIPKFLWLAGIKIFINVQE